jgi:hypothetical protein
MEKEVKVLTAPTGNLQTNFLSIKELQEKQQAKESKPADLLQGKPKKAFTQDDLVMAWKRFAYRCKEDGRDTLFAALSARDPKLLPEDTVVEHLVDNTIQRSFLEAAETDLLTYLRNELQNWGISIKFEDVKVEESKTLYSGKDKFDEMAKRNPHLLTLQKRFKLDIDF